MQTFRQLNSLPRGLREGLSRGHDVTLKRRRSQTEPQLHAKIWALFQEIVALSKRKTHTQYTCNHNHKKQSRVYPSLAAVTSWGYGRFLFDFKQCLPLSCPVLFPPVYPPVSLSVFSIFFFFFLLYFLLISPFPPQKIRRQTKTWRQKERQVEEMAKLIGITVRERDKATVPCCWLRLVKPAPAITYILTPILTADSTQNYHLPSMTILQAHPQFQWSCYLKAGQRPTTTISATFSAL